MKRILIFCIMVALTSCAAVVPSKNNVGKVLPTPSGIDNAIVLACAGAIARIETDRIEDTLTLCVDRVWEFFKDNDHGCLTDAYYTYFTVLGVVNKWADAGIKTYAEAYGCNSRQGCTIILNKTPADKIVTVLEEEMIEQGGNLCLKDE